LYRGRLAVIEQTFVPGQTTRGSVFHLLVWRGATWQLQGELLLPCAIDAGSVGPTDGDQSYLSTWGGATQVFALDIDGKTHWFCTDGSQTLYTGENVIIPEGTVSALAAENEAVRIPGWIAAGSRQFEVGSDAQGPLLLSGGGRSGSPFMNETDLTVLRLTGGRWTEAQKLQRRGAMISRLASDGTRAFVVGFALSKDLALTEIVESGVKKSSLTIEDKGASMDRLSRSAQNFAVWMPHVVVILYAILASWLMAVYRTTGYEYGNSSVELASIIRRTLAKIVDWLLVILPVLILQWVLYGTLDQEKIFKAFSQDLDLIGLFRKLAFGLLGFLIYGVVWLTGLAITEGFWGISPGKWLCGIRVVRTTLRRCGFFRAVLRELILFVDCFMCVGWVASTCCVAFTDCRQRIGDLLADTIVIRRPSTDAASGAGEMTVDK
jgi:uncharacterized RDD family membrane protein YckC